MLHLTGKRSRLNGMQQKYKKWKKHLVKKYIFVFFKNRNYKYKYFKNATMKRCTSITSIKYEKATVVLQIVHYWSSPWIIIVMNTMFNLFISSFIGTYSTPNKTNTIWINWLNYYMKIYSILDQNQNYFVFIKCHNIST